VYRLLVASPLWEANAVKHVYFRTNKQIHDGGGGGDLMIGWTEWHKLFLLMSVISFIELGYIDTLVHSSAELEIMWLCGAFDWQFCFAAKLWSESSVIRDKFS